jgi:hypothetical protein
MSLPAENNFFMFKGRRPFKLKKKLSAANQLTKTFRLISIKTPVSFRRTIPLSTLNLFYMPLVRRLSHNIFIFGSGFSYTAVYMCFFRYKKGLRQTASCILILFLTAVNNVWGIRLYWQFYCSPSWLLICNQRPYSQTYDLWSMISVMMKFSMWFSSRSDHIITMNKSAVSLVQSPKIQQIGWSRRLVKTNTSTWLSEDYYYVTKRFEMLLHVIKYIMFENTLYYFYWWNITYLQA